MPNNTFQVTNELVNKSLDIIESNAVVLKMVDRYLDPKFDRERGDTIRIPKHVYFTVGDGPDITATINDIEQGTVSLILNRHKNLSWNISRRELAHEVRESTLQNLAKSAAMTLLQVVESDIMDTAYKGIYNLVNPATPTVGPASVSDINDVDVLLDDQGVPMGKMERKMIVSSATMGALGTSLISVFVTRIAEAAIEGSYAGTMAGIDLYKSVSAPLHMNGLHSTNATPVINGAAQDVVYTDTLTDEGQTIGRNSFQTLITDGWDAGLSTITAGSSFTIDGVFRVKGHALKTPTTSLQVFVVNEDAVSAGGAITMNISPAIIASGPYATVTAAPGDGDAINMIGPESTGVVQHLAFHRNAITVAFGKFAAPTSDAVRSTTDSVGGFSLTVSQTSSFNNMKEVVRYDVLWGVLVQNPHFATRYSGE